MVGAVVVLASVGANTMSPIARLVHADEDAVRQVIPRLNRWGWPHWWVAVPPYQS
jgi:hypothetical protein